MFVRMRLARKFTDPANGRSAKAADAFLTDRGLILRGLAPYRLPGALRLRKLDDGPGRYDLTRTATGAVECTCPDYLHRAKSEGRPCKHATALAALGLLPCLTIPEVASAEEPQD